MATQANVQSRQNNNEATKDSQNHNAQLQPAGAKQGITPCLWFDTQAEEAANFYVALFKNSKLGQVSRYGDAAAEASGQPKGSAMTVSFQLSGQEFLGLNGGPVFQFSPAISFVVNCENQEEIDRLWDALAQGGEIQQCGWLKDKYGVSWQIVPTILPELIKSQEPGKAERVMAALMKMTKLNIRILEQA